LITTQNNEQRQIALEYAAGTKRKAEPGFLKKNKRWLIIGAGASAAISVGAVLLSGGKDSKLPNPPGRPALQK